MKTHDWNAVAARCIHEAGGDPRFVLQSMDAELEKVAGFLDWGARVLGRGAIGAGERLGALGVTRGVGEGMSRWGAGVFERQAATQAARATAAGEQLARLGAADSAALGGGMRKTLAQQTTKTLGTQRAATNTAKAYTQLAQRGSANADAMAALRGKTPVPQMPAPAPAPVAAAPAVPAAAAPAAAAPAAAPAAPAGAPGQPGWGDRLKTWWGNPQTPAWQRYGLVAGGAAVPAAGLGLMAGGGNTTVIQR